MQLSRQPPAFPSPFAAEPRAHAAAPSQSAEPADTAQAAENVRKVAAEFEAMVLAQMLQSTFAQIDPNGLGGGGAGEEMFRPLLVDQYAQSMARAGGIGLADSVVRELTRLQIAPTPIPAEDPHGAHR